MVETATVAVEEKTTAKEVFDPIWLNTLTGAVAVYGHELVSKQVLNIIGACLNSSEFEDSHHGVFSLVFSKDKIENSNNEEVYAMFFPEVKSIVVNLLKIWDNAVEEALGEEKGVSVVCAIHHNLLFHVFHDIHHAASHAAGVDIFDLSEDEHEKSSTWANEKLIELAKIINIEPHWKSEPFFSPLIQEMFINISTDEKDPVVLRAKKMVEEGVLVKDEEEGKDPLIIKSFREFIRLLTKDKEGWEEKVLTKTFLSEPEKVTTPAQPLETEYVDTNYVPWNDDEETLVAATFGGSPVSTNPIVQTMPGIPTPAQPLFAPQLFPIPSKPTPFPTNNIDPSSAPAILSQVYMACYTHIFNGCGMLVNSEIAFQNPEIVTQQPVDLNSIPGAAAIVVAADINDASGAWLPEKQIEGGLLFGNLKRNTKLPGFTLHINVNGEHHVRALIPQNPATSSSTAVRARAGNAIMWIVDNATDRNDKSRWKFKIDNGVLTPCGQQYASA